MKKMIIAMVAMLTMSATTQAMSYEQARNEALFLTDKMAYELNLTDEQYEAAYEINLDYLMGVTSQADVFGTYWERRNLDMSYILLEWQWNAFLNATYFYRPLFWEAGYWHFGVYARYPRRDYFYFGRPAFYATYRGAHAWHRVGGPGFYHGRRDHFAPRGRSHFGMRDGWDRGDFRRGHDIRHSSTRTTVGHGGRGRGGITDQRTHGGYTPRTNGHTTRPFDRTTRPTDRTTRPTDRTTRPTDRTTRPTDRGTFGGSTRHGGTPGVTTTPRTTHTPRTTTSTTHTPRTSTSTTHTPRTTTSTTHTPRTSTPATRSGSTFGGGHGGNGGGHGGHGGGGGFGRHR